MVSIVLIILAGLAAYAWMEKTEAETRGRIALLAAQSRSLLESEHDLALLLSVEANRLAEDLASPATLGTGLMKRAGLALSKENYAAGAAKSSLFAALTLLPQRVRFFHGTGQIMAFSPDGQKFAFLKDKNLVIYDLAIGQEVGQPLTGINHIEDIDHMTFSSDGHILVSRWGDRTDDPDNDTIIGTWEVNKGRTLGPSPKRPKGEWDMVAFSPDEKLLASITGKDDHIVIRDRTTLEPLSTLKITGNPVSLEFSQNSKFLLCRNDEGGLIRWDLATRKPVILPFTINPDAPPHRQPLTSFDWSPDGKVAALLDLGDDAEEQTIDLYDMQKGKQVGRIVADRSDLASLAFSPNGKILAARGEPGVFLWDVLRQRPLSPLLTGHMGWVAKFRFSPDGKHLASADNLGNIILWNLTGTSLSRELDTQNLGAECVAFTPHGREMALAGT
jgi:WD40 repeat protein